jgi:hypothetical protein
LRGTARYRDWPPGAAASPSFKDGESAYDMEWEVLRVILIPVGVAAGIALVAFIHLVLAIVSAKSRPSALTVSMYKLLMSTGGRGLSHVSLID